MLLNRVRWDRVRIELQTNRKSRIDFPCHQHPIDTGTSGDFPSNPCTLFCARGYVWQGKVAEYFDKCTKRAMEPIFRKRRYCRIALLRIPQNQYKENLAIQKQRLCGLHPSRSETRSGLPCPVSLQTCIALQSRTLAFRSECFFALRPGELGCRNRIGVNRKRF